MSLLQNEDFTIWQLRTSYLSIIKDGIGDRLINVNNSVLNTPGFRAAGWLPTSTIPTTQESGSLIKRTYSPPIPTTAAVASEYFQFGRHNARELRDGDGLSIDDGEEDEGGMVTGGGGGSTYTFGVKHHGKSARKNRRRDRQNQIAERPGQGEDEDSSDLSDESDDESEFTRAAQQIKFSKMPVRNRTGSLPLHDSRDASEEVPVTDTGDAVDRTYRRSSVGAVAPAQGRPRGDTVTSSDMSEGDNPALFKRRQIQFSSQHQVIEEPADDVQENSESHSADINDQDEDFAEGSADSDLLSDFGVTAGSASLLADVALNATLDSSPAMMHKLPNASSNGGASPRKAKVTTTPGLQELPPPRPISTLQPVSLLSKELNARKAVPSNPVEKFASLWGGDSNTALNIKIYAPFSEDPETPFNMPIFRETRDQDRIRPVTVADAIGLALWRYIKDDLKPAIDRSKLNVNRWTLRMVEDGEVDFDFPALGRHLPLADFTSNNNRYAGMRGRSRGKQYDEFALVEATDAEFAENSRLYPKYNPEPVAETSEANSTPHTPGNITPQIKPNVSAARLNPILGQPFPSALNDNTLTPADMPAPTSHATPRLGVQKTLKVRFVNVEGSTQITTVNTTTDSYIAEILDSVCKRWGLDKGNYLLKVQGTNTIAPPDRTVEVLGNVSELDVIRRRFGAVASLAGSPGSASPNAPLQIGNSNLGHAKKGKKGHHQMLHPLAQPQKQDLVGGYYRRYYVYRKQSMSFTASNQRVLVLDNDYLHVMPGETAKGVFDTTGKTRSINFNDIVGTKVSRRHPKSFSVVVLRGTDAHEQKRYDFEARNEAEAAEIVGEIKKNMEQYRAW